MSFDFIALHPSEVNEQISNSTSSLHNVKTFEIKKNMTNKNICVSNKVNQGLIFT